jgi:hypothetical protein
VFGLLKGAEAWSRLGESNPRPTHYEDYDRRVRGPPRVHRCKSGRSPCTFSPTRRRRFVPRTVPRRRSLRGSARQAEPRDLHQLDPSPTRRGPHRWRAGELRNRTSSPALQDPDPSVDRLRTTERPRASPPAQRGRCDRPRRPHRLVSAGLDAATSHSSRTLL